MAFCGYKLWDSFYQKVENDKTIDKIQSVANASGTDSSFEPDWAGMMSLNSEISAYLYYPKLELSFPVAAGTNNTYYLSHDLYGNYSIYGSIFLDKDCSDDYNAKNNIIYGHSVSYQETGMFTTIKRMKDSSVFSSCNKFILYTPSQNYLCEVFSFRYIPVKSSPYRISFSDSEDFLDWVNEIKTDSMYVDESVSLSATSRVITLSTCADNGVNRYVVHAKMTAVDKISSSEVE